MSSQHDLDALTDTIGAVHPNTIPDAALEDARYALADTLAAAAYAHTTPAPSDNDEVPGGPATVWWTGRRAPATEAAFANAYRVHAHEFDSVHYLTLGHPAAVSLPAMLALYETGIGDPVSVLAGYVLSVEVMAVLAARFGPALRAGGYHPTVVLGAPACAGSCAWLLGGTASAIRWAMAYAASSTIGFDTHFGSDIKALQVATCASTGLRAAQLAMRETKVPSRMPWYTPIVTLAGAAPEPAEPHVFGQPWAAELVPTRCKPLPICGYFDPVLTAWRDRPASLPEPATIRRVTVEAPDYLLQANRFAQPRNLDEARFSLPFLIAVLMRHHNVTPTACNPSQLTDTGFRRTMDTVHVISARAGDPGAIHVFDQDREWSLPLRPSAADARTTWPQLRDKLIGCGLAGRARELIAHIRAFETSTPTRWQALTGPNLKGRAA